MNHIGKNISWIWIWWRFWFQKSSGTWGEQLMIFGRGIFSQSCLTGILPVQQTWIFFVAFFISWCSEYFEWLKSLECRQASSVHSSATKPCCRRSQRSRASIVHLSRFSESFDCINVSGIFSQFKPLISRSIVLHSYVTRTHLAVAGQECRCCQGLITDHFLLVFLS